MKRNWELIIGRVIVRHAVFLLLLLAGYFRAGATMRDSDQRQVR